MIIIIKKTLLYLIVFLVVTNCSAIKKYDFTGLSDSVVEDRPKQSHQPCEVSGGRLLWFILLINVHQSITHVCCLYCILGVDADREGKVSACLVCLSYCIVRMCFAFLILLLYFWIPDLLLIPCA